MFTAKHQKGVAFRLIYNLELLLNLTDCKKRAKQKKYSDENLISPIIIAVKRSHSTELALFSKNLNKSFHKNKYQALNIEMLIDFISQLLTDTQVKQVYFSIIDLKYTYSEVK